MNALFVGANAWIAKISRGRDILNSMGSSIEYFVMGSVLAISSKRGRDKQQKWLR